VPSQVGTLPQAPPAEPQTYPAGRMKAQPGDVPVQVVEKAQGPKATPQSVPAGKKASGGQSALAPSHFSATSQPAAKVPPGGLARQV
jgi:hypothetical protein